MNHDPATWDAAVAAAALLCDADAKQWKELGNSDIGGHCDGIQEEGSISCANAIRSLIGKCPEPVGVCVPREPSDEWQNIAIDLNAALGAVIDKLEARRLGKENDFEQRALDAAAKTRDKFNFLLAVLPAAQQGEQSAQPQVDRKRHEPEQSAGSAAAAPPREKP